ncbi:alpha/beta fold hydrolase [Kitasatospora sp. NPDC004615]|uniref:alpha/beta fold hydrolase n=1 Tax=unclassified Kitasatospora TaxID=2633591 RepID=UPI0036BF26CE
MYATRRGSPRHRPWALSADHIIGGESLRIWERPGAPDDAPHVVLAHGFEENWDTWLRLAALIPPGLRLSALDLPWRAGSSYAWTEHGSSAVWLERALELLEEPATALVAHSFGASSLLELLARDVPAVKAPAVLVAPVYRPHDRAVDPEYFTEAVTRFRRVLTEGMSVQLGPRAQRLDAELLELMQRRIRDRVEPHGFLQFYAMLARIPGLTLDRITVPVQLISGTKDMSAPPAAVRELRSRISDLTVHQSNRLSHFCQVEQAEEVAAEVLTFLGCLGIGFEGDRLTDPTTERIRIEEAISA